MYWYFHSNYVAGIFSKINLFQLSFVSLSLLRMCLYCVSVPGFFSLSISWLFIYLFLYFSLEFLICQLVNWTVNTMVTHLILIQFLMVLYYLYIYLYVLEPLAIINLLQSNDVILEKTYLTAGVKPCENCTVSSVNCSYVTRDKLRR